MQEFQETNTSNTHTHIHFPTHICNHNLQFSSYGAQTTTKKKTFTFHNLRQLFKKIEPSTQELGLNELRSKCLILQTKHIQWSEKTNSKNDSFRRNHSSKRMNLVNRWGYLHRITNHQTINWNGRRRKKNRSWASDHCNQTINEQINVRSLHDWEMWPLQSRDSIKFLRKKSRFDSFC